jgi:hypothetical protein
MSKIYSNRPTSGRLTTDNTARASITRLEKKNASPISPKKGGSEEEIPKEEQDQIIDMLDLNAPIIATDVTCSHKSSLGTESVNTEPDWAIQHSKTTGPLTAIAGFTKSIFTSWLGLRVLRDLLSTPTNMTPDAINVAAGEKFFHTRQGVNKKCALHALNAFFGKPAVDLNLMNKTAEEILSIQREFYLSFQPKWRKMAAFILGVPFVSGQGKYKGFETNTVQRLLFRHHNMPTDKREIYLDGHSQNMKYIAEFKENLQGLDRCMINYGSESSSHWVAFRKDTNDKWYLIDSQKATGNQPQINPWDYLTDRIQRGKKRVAQVIYELKFEPLNKDSGIKLSKEITEVFDNMKAEWSDAKLVTVEKNEVAVTKEATIDKNKGAVTKEATVDEPEVAVTKKVTVGELKAALTNIMNEMKQNDNNKVVENIEVINNYIEWVDANFGQELINKLLKISDTYKKMNPVKVVQSVETAIPDIS